LAGVPAAGAGAFAGGAGFNSAGTLATILLTSDGH
jgi:hypothetical protein